MGAFFIIKLDNKSIAVTGIIIVVRVEPHFIMAVVLSVFILCPPGKSFRPGN
jgi:hypothetical protein